MTKTLKGGAGEAGVVVKERQVPYGGLVVEGTDQCLNCRRFMSLGEGRLCLGVSGAFEDAAEIVGWIPGRCARFIKEEAPFEGRPPTGPALF